jgi:tetratricopeptide (TPR) repeat protein
MNDLRKMNIQATESPLALDRSRAIAWLLLLPLVMALGCGANAAIQANQRQVEQNEALIEQQQRDIERLKAEQPGAPEPVPGTTGSCDKGVEATATRRGGDAYSSGDMSKALGYYQDALTACPSSSRADMNLARVYETLDNRDAAIRYYRAAASAKDSDGAKSSDANAALARLGVR